MHERITARGHEHVTARHESTLEVTSDDYLTPAGDCILGIEADRVPTDFDRAFVEACRDEAATITASIETADHGLQVTGRGDPALSFESDRSLVVRTSEYVDDRTVMVDADAAAADIDRPLVDDLADGAAVTITLTVT